MSRRSTRRATVANAGRVLDQASDAVSPPANKPSSTHNASPSESPTIVGDGFTLYPSSLEDADDIPADVPSASSRQPTPSSSTTNTKSSQPSTKMPDHLEKRIPSVATMLNKIKKDTILLGLFEDGPYFCDQSHQKIHSQRREGHREEAETV